MRKKIKKIPIFLEKVFNEKITKEDYYWHLALTIMSFALLFIAAADIFEIYFYHQYSHAIHIIEFIFGILFMIEVILRVIFSIIPNSDYWNWTIPLNFIIAISLLLPGFFGNLGILRIIRSLKVVKTYKLLDESKKMKKEIS